MPLQILRDMWTIHKQPISLQMSAKDTSPWQTAPIQVCRGAFQCSETACSLQSCWRSVWRCHSGWFVSRWGKPGHVWRWWMPHLAACHWSSSLHHGDGFSWGSGWARSQHVYDMFDCVCKYNYCGRSLLLIRRGRLNIKACRIWRRLRTVSPTCGCVSHWYLMGHICICFILAEDFVIHAQTTSTNVPELSESDPGIPSGNQGKSVSESFM